MKRRDFLAMLSLSGVAATAGGALVFPESLQWPWSTRGGQIHLSHRRQTFSGLVTVDLDLPKGDWGGLTPRPVVIRESAPGWWRELALEAGVPSRVDDLWRWHWSMPVVRPTDDEYRAEVIRFRVALLESSNATLGEDSIGLTSDPVEVVCGPGWSV